MLNVAAKVSEATTELVEGIARANGGNGSAGIARSQVISVLGPGMTVTGDVSGEGEFRIEGNVEGSISSAGRVVVGSSGQVLGDIEAVEVVASGKVSGKITASGSVRLESGCEIEADVEAATIALEDGGIVNGRLKMGSP